MQSALVTGGSGFIGSHLVSRLQEMGWTVSVLSRDPQRASSILQDIPQSAVCHYDGSYESVLASVETSEPDVVFHLASHFVAEHKIADIEPLLESNLCFGTRLLEAMSTTGVRHFVNTGTSWQNFHGDAYDPVCLYAATKQAFEDMLFFYAASGRVSAITLKLFDTYGPGDTRPKLLPALRRAAQSSEVLRMSPGEQKLDLVYIDDVVDAYVRASKRLGEEHIDDTSDYAVTSGQAVPLRGLVELMQELTGGKPEVEWGARPYRVREVMEPWKGGQVVPGWAPKVGLREGLERFLQSD